MGTKSNLLVLLVLCFYFSYSSAQTYELKPLLDESIFEILKSENIQLEQDDVHLIPNRYRLDQLYNEFEPLLQQGICVKPFFRVPLNQPLDSHRIYTIKTSSGHKFMVIDRSPIRILDKNDPNAGFGTAVGGLSFNDILYSFCHPGLKARKKRTAIKCAQITRFVYPE